MTPSQGLLLEKRVETGEVRCLPAVRRELAVALGLFPFSLEPFFSFIES